MLIDWDFAKKMIEKGHNVNTIGWILDAHPETIHARAKIEGWTEQFREDDEVPAKLLSRRRYENVDQYLSRGAV